MIEQPVFTNRLVHETSPYLRQHAHNPVEWYPWGPEALARARELDRPIFLSIGYSACHWCHVMEHESFEDAEVAAVLNEHFVSIKVDREERPDLDQIYMSAVQLLTGQGGWPMSVFLTPALEPFYGGTYFPPDDRFGRPSFKRLLQTVVEAWANQRPQLDEAGVKMAEQIRLSTRVAAAEGALDASLIRRAVSLLSRVFDPTYGGFGSAPKFPHPMEIRLLLRACKRFDDDEALSMARRTLDRMAMGGLYDHLGGGFHRYSTDAYWLVPHFEKMLYDNALLGLAYLEAFQASGDALYRAVVEETLAYVCREMTSPEGPFYSTQDADSEGVEGKFFVWSAGAIEAVLDPKLAEVFNYVYGVTQEGNWEGGNILHRAKTFEQNARVLDLPEEELRHRLDEARHQLHEIRGRRVRPGRDEKMLTAWNGLMIATFAQAGQVLDNPGYVDQAVRAADFLLRRLRGPDGLLLRTYSTGSEPKLNGYLDDYAYFIDALVALYEATFAPRWLESALELTEVMIEQFWDAAESGFFYTGRDHEALIARPKDMTDSSVPSGNAQAVTALLRLAKLTGRLDLLEKAEASLRLGHALMANSPLAAGQMLIALDFYLGPVDEFALVGDLADPETRRAVQAVQRGFRPGKVVALKSTTAAAEHIEDLLPLLQGKEARGAVTTYICRSFTCKEPIVGAAALEKYLQFH